MTGLYRCSKESMASRITAISIDTCEYRKLTSTKQFLIKEDKLVMVFIGKLTSF